MAKCVQMFDIKSRHSTVTRITQHISAKFRKYFIPFREQKRSNFLCFLSCWHEKRPSLAISDIAKIKYHHDKVWVFPGSEVPLWHGIHMIETIVAIVWKPLGCMETSGMVAIVRSTALRSFRSLRSFAWKHEKFDIKPADLGQICTTAKIIKYCLLSRKHS